MESLRHIAASAPVLTIGMPRRPGSYRPAMLPSDDPDVARPLAVIDQVLRRTTTSGTGFYRYGTAAAGTEDGYGDCSIGDATGCTVQGEPGAGVCQIQIQIQGSGHLWPVLGGERGAHAVATGARSTAVGLWQSTAAGASGIVLVPEQGWQNAAVAASAFGPTLECAAIGLENGEAAGTASPLPWSAAQLVQLSAAIRAGRLTEQPQDTTELYISHTQVGTAVTLTSPQTTRSSLDPSRCRGAQLRVRSWTSTPRTSPAPAPSTVTPTVLATAPGGATGFAQRSFEVEDSGPDSVTFRVQTTDLSATFGSTLGAPLVDV